MKQTIKRPEIKGTRSGYVIRFTCPECVFENIIVCKMPKDFFRESHDASCKRCRQRLTILTPYRQNRNNDGPVSQHRENTLEKDTPSLVGTRDPAPVIPAL